MKMHIRLFLILCLLLTVIGFLLYLRNIRKPSYSITNLDTLGGDESIAFSINNLGEVVGQSYVISTSAPSEIGFSTQRGVQVSMPHPPSGTQSAFLWANGKMEKLNTLLDRYGNLGCDDMSIAYSINDTSEIVGESSYGTCPEEGLPSYDAVIWHRGKPTDLGVVAGYPDSEADKINNTGEVAGHGILEEHGPTTYLYHSCSALFSLGMGVKTSALSNGFTINNRGQKLGSVRRGIRNYLVLWQGTKVVMATKLPQPEYLLSSSLDDNGEAVVTLTENSGDDPTAYGLFQAETWVKGHLQPLPALHGYPETFAKCINNLGGAVGDSHQGEGDEQELLSSSRAVVWHNGVVTDLNSLIPMYSGWTLENANGINDKGQIVGFGEYFGHRRAFLLTPIVANAVVSK